MAADKEQIESFTVPAVWSNRFNVTTFDNNTVRIAFAECAKITGGVEVQKFHSAVLMTQTDAVMFRDLLTKLLP